MFGKKINMNALIKKIVLGIIIMVAFPHILPYLGVNVNQECITYTVADYEAAKAMDSVTITKDDIGTCVQETSADDGVTDRAEYLSDTFWLLMLIIGLLVFSVPGYHIFMY